MVNLLCKNKKIAHEEKRKFTLKSKMTANINSENCIIPTFIDFFSERYVKYFTHII